MYDEDQYQFKLPPVVLPQGPPSTKVKRTVSEMLVSVPDNFKSQVLAIDDNSVQSLEFLNEGSYLAVGIATGNIRIINTKQGNVQFLLKSQDNSPVTGLAANPSSAHIRHAVLATHSEGTLQYWHATSRQLLFSKKYSEMLQTCEISPEGTHYAFSSEHGKIRYGLLNKGEPVEVQSGHWGKHDNRVFCLKWDPEDNNVMVSGGWDKTVHFWDLRTKHSVKHLYGYYIGGQAIDFRGNQLLLGNNTNERPLCIYDRKADKTLQLPWPYTSQQQGHHPTGVLSCFFMSKHSDDIVSCSVKNQLRLYRDNKMVSQHIEKKNQQTGAITQPIEQEEEENRLRLYCMQHERNANKVVTGWSDGAIRWYSF